MLALQLTAHAASFGGLFVAPLPFNLGLVQFLADHRNTFLTKLANIAAFAGGVEGYILLAALIYVVWNKRLAIQLSVVMLAALSINDLLKMLVRNPRPFIAQGTYLQKWAVPAKMARDLAMEFSTPSGHATGAAAFYAYLYGFVRNRAVRVIAVAAILFIGVSRPYLGVHYFEDVFLGWALGLTVAAVGLRYAEAIAVTWNRVSHWLQVAIIAPAGLALWLIAVLLNGHSTTGQPYSYLCYGGFLTGVVIARPLELSKVNFDPRSSTILVKILRYLLSVGLLILTLFALETIFLLVTYRDSMFWNLLEYVRFIAAGFVTVFLAPWVFTKIGWAGTLTDGTSSFAA
jgi:membrane-associated phospholipid phosphatase